MDRISRKMAIYAVAAISALASGTQSAQAEFPDKPVSLIVPYRAGGSIETMARVLAPAMAKELGQNVVVVTKPGAGGAVGATELAASPPDGYKVMMIASSSILWPPLAQDVEYDHESFTYVAQLVSFQQALVAKTDAPFNSLEELIEHAKANSLNYADQSAMSRAFVNYIGKQEGVEWTGIPTKGGGEMVPFLLGGKVDFAWSGGIHNRYPDDIKVLASMNADRLIGLPDVPSVFEKYNISMPSHGIVVVPASTPDDVVAKLRGALENAIKDPDFADLVNNKLKFPIQWADTATITDVMNKSSEALVSVVAATK